MSAKKHNNNSINFLIGTSGWSYNHWKCVFYPNGLPQNKWFGFYTTYFSTVEVNATFYRSFKDQTYFKWYEKAPEKFYYVLKVPRIITHRKYLHHVEDDIKNFNRSAQLLKEKFGLMLLQLAPKTKYDPELLRHVLAAFDNPQKVAIEFRHKKWMTNEIKELLTEVGSVFCIAESSKTELCDWLTTEVAYIRLHGRKQWYAYDYTEHELQEIADLSQILVHKGAKQIYIFFNNDFEGYAIKNATELKGILLKENSR